ncbi:ABC transporter permease [Fretibacterium fastidiosum]|uniref:ABC-type dipeptide/oligopeptide/nickel transport systems, permease components n=1 Tax=Fretibacterium fastidiosum TaxID=651822 RepID=A0AB94IW33_9BACT|nr:ABC transporter permease [Fretibacterium fastidiosum]CBL27968.1 ABC-type dipeptide/oligopeptide/nickel transport systems, permease components [Fretibacterium fastidiosum]
MKTYIVKRVLTAAATLFAIVLALFLMLELMPGSPFNDEKLSPEQVAVLREKYGLDGPVLIRFARYVGRMMTGDLGVSYNIQKNVPVTEMIRARLPISIRIGLQAVFVGAVLGLLLGVLAALRHNSIADTFSTVVSVLGVSVPSFVFAFVLLYYLGFKAGWFPTLYKVNRPAASTVLPTLALSMFTLAQIARFARSEMLEALGSEYMLFAQSKGLSPFRTNFVHALRNVLIPIITVLAPLIVNLMTGSMVVEKIFSIPGVGSLLVTAIQSNDYNVVISLTFVYCVLYIGLMLVVDLLYGVIDPRIRLAGGKRHD